MRPKRSCPSPNSRAGSSTSSEPSLTATTRPGRTRQRSRTPVRSGGRPPRISPIRGRISRHVEAVVDRRGAVCLPLEPPPLPRLGPCAEPIGQVVMSCAGTDVTEQVVAEPVGLDDPRVQGIGDAVLRRDELEIRIGALELLGDPRQLRVRPAGPDPLRERRPRISGPHSPRRFGGNANRANSSGPGSHEPTVPARPRSPSPGPRTSPTSARPSVAGPPGAGAGGSIKRMRPSSRLASADHGGSTSRWRRRCPRPAGRGPPRRWAPGSCRSGSWRGPRSRAPHRRGPR